MYNIQRQDRESERERERAKLRCPSKLKGRSLHSHAILPGSHSYHKSYTTPVMYTCCFNTLCFLSLSLARYYQLSPEFARVCLRIHRVNRTHRGIYWVIEISSHSVQSSEYLWSMVYLVIKRMAINSRGPFLASSPLVKRILSAALQCLRAVLSKGAKFSFRLSPLFRTFSTTCLTLQLSSLCHVGN